MLRTIVRRWAGLPPARHATSAETRWVALSDGVRLATRCIHPRGIGRAPTVLLRTAASAPSGPRAVGALATCLAESGHHVVLQHLRGRADSEGRFTPFAHEARDGGEAVDWVERQEFFDGKLALVGFGLDGHAAWAAAAARPERSAALVVGFAASDPWQTLHTDGALDAATALHLGVGIGEREDAPASVLDLARALRFRPFLEADRVALHRSDWFRDWLEREQRDAWWEDLCAALPDPAPPTLLVAGWYDASLRGQLADHALLAERARERGSPPPELVAGPWSGTGRPSQRGSARPWLGPVIEFLERTLGGEAAGRQAPVRLLPTHAERWLRLPAWPAETDSQVLYLRGAGRARSAAGDGRLDPTSAPREETPDRFSYDPEEPTPSLGGAQPAPAAGPLDQRALERRGDVLCYTGARLERDLEILGSVRAELFVASSAEDTDFVAKLVDVDPSGRAALLAEGICRCRWRESPERPAWLVPEVPLQIGIDLGPTCARVRAGHRLRLDVCSASLPRFDRNPNTREAPARAEKGIVATQTVFHDGARPSRLILPVAQGRASNEEARGPSPAGLPSKHRSGG